MPALISPCGLPSCVSGPGESVIQMLAADKPTLLLRSGYGPNSSPVIVCVFGVF